jgi:hypothetical protein
MPSPRRAAFLLFLLVLLCAAGAGWLTGCNEEELTGTRVPNILPETKLVSTPPTQVPGGYTVRFAWTGYDPDGEVRRFEWKLCPIGRDGIGVQDTLSMDPATGEALHPWCCATGQDTVLMVLADQRPEPDAPPAEADLFTQVHTFLVRAVDDRGEADPTPAFVSFTASTIAPSIWVDRPVLLSYAEAQPMPPSPTFGYTGLDPDCESGDPTRVRHLLKRAWYQDHFIRTRYEFNYLWPYLISESDSLWSDWTAYPPHPEDRQLRFHDLELQDAGGRTITYILALQCADTAGAVSVDWTYGRSVVNFFVSQGMTPYLTMQEHYLGQRRATGTLSRATCDVAQGQPLQFSWTATAADYNGTIVSYHWGWDLYDPDDPDDPQWALPPGNTPEHRQTPLRTFSTGTHTLTIEARDDTGQLTRFVWVLAVVPVPDYTQQPLLLVDDVPDRSSNAWLAADGVSPLDNDVFRDAFWREMLTGQGGVEGFDPLRDVVDLEDEELGLRRLVNYRAAIWTSRYAQSNFVWRNFKPLSDFSMRYIWLASYQQSAGNLFLIGSNLLLQFLPGGSWIMPFVLDTDEGGPPLIGGPWTIFAGLGTVELPDGTIANAGTLLYPSQDLGVATLDAMDPRGHVIYGCINGPGGPGPAGCRRRSTCSGTKALVRDSDFALAHPSFTAGVAESIFTDARIDWRDLDPGFRDALSAWDWGGTEFYDTDIAGRPTPWAPQDCDGQPCVEPMFRSLSRYDWVAELHAAAGDPDWPGSVFTPEELEDVCGSRTLAPGADRSLTSGLPIGFLSHKLVAEKPSRRADVVWGFDPYRFDHARIASAVRWVLGEHFGLTMQP